MEFAQEKGLADQAFIAGGAVRDILSGAELKDIDIAVKGDALYAAEMFAEQTGSSFVPLDKDFGIARVVKGGKFLDISVLRGDSIYDDLASRDITINAMAIPLLEGRSPQIERKIIDPHGGKSDIFNKIIRMVSDTAFIRDPLRILRIYRFAATLNFSIEEETLKTAKRLALLIPSVAVERITEELKHILKLDNSYEIFSGMMDDGILSYILPEFQQTEERFKEADEGVRGSALELYKETEEILNNLPAYFLGYSDTISRYFDTDYKKPCLKLSTVFHDFESAESAAIRLKISRKEIKFIHKMALNRRQFFNLYARRRNDLDKTAAITLFKEFHVDLYPLLILTIAQSLKTTEKQYTIPFCQKVLALYHNEFKPALGLLPIITGDDLIHIFDLKPSPVFKEILSAIEDMVLVGRINSKKEALKEVENIILRSQVI
ncbi:hypothetical protein M1N52_02155 [Thermodesulfovibrionales bacterium]|nr:hypothetical protein [Thermodesulfovibrionales bacterium]